MGKKAAEMFALKAKEGDGGAGGEDLAQKLKDLEARLTAAEDTAKEKDEKIHKQNRENENLRKRFKGFLDVARTKFGGETEEEVRQKLEEFEAGQSSGNDDPDDEDTTTGKNTPPRGKPADDPRVNKLLKEVEALKAENQRKDEEAKKSAQEAKKEKLRNTVIKTLSDIGIAGEDIPVAAAFIRDSESGANLREDEDAGLVWSPPDPKTGKAVDLPFDKSSVEQYLPKKFLPGKGGGGSGGGSPRTSGSAKTKATTEAQNIVNSQAAYEAATKGKSDQEIVGVQRSVQENVAGVEQ